ncbi:N-formylglutamate amidohydrolase [Shimia sp. MMG029]|uniref:N-formylglutamate amidohydrolase n=1 Tax=Shimia sp. MMG029 TaxID=3021978 RepID=UPI0022FF02B5|nr:N-formylglutamate amidohydrolase [Shimia sp. MMG029]MDA5556370.1 N-formylglutamate amidohydrolase [Shimia sp. MMG029]
MTLEDDEVVHVEGAVAPCDVLFVCEHASNYFPESFGDLGLSDEVRESHVAWDPGALALTRLLAERFDSSLVAGGVSRLLYDCNRPPVAESAIPQRSEIFDIPGNVGLSDAAREARVEQIYVPFRGAVEQVIAMLEPKAIVTVHSFTPIYHGAKRDVEIGILHDRDTRLADGMLEALAGAPHDVQRNAPYGPEDGVTHSLKLYGLATKTANVMLEVRNDLLRTETQIAHMADVIEGALQAALAGLAKDTKTEEGR